MNIIERADRLFSMRGCFSTRATVSGRRRYDRGEDTLFPHMSPFLVDVCNYLEDKSGRRMGLKTQVVTGSLNAHVRTRATHTNEVASVAVRIASVLGLNTNFVLAMALGHDIGHPPLGHLGERYIQKRTGKRFRNNYMSVAIAQHIARKGLGINATHEVLSGIGHGREAAALQPSLEMCFEHAVLMYADKFAYITADYNDLIRLGSPLPEELRGAMTALGIDQRERLQRLITDLCLESAERGYVVFEESESAKIFFQAKDILYGHYDRVNVCEPERILDPIYALIEHAYPGEVDPALMFALMTDRDVENLAQETFPSEMHLRATTAGEFIEVLRGKRIKWWELDLEW